MKWNCEARDGGGWVVFASLGDFLNAEENTYSRAIALHPPQIFHPPTPHTIIRPTFQSCLEPFISVTITFPSIVEAAI